MAVAACDSRTPTARERALAQIPATADVIAAADGTALADPTFRRVLDAARAHVPAELGCVIDASLTSEAIALASTQTGATVAIITRALVARCPALSKIGDDIYVATIGSGAVSISRDVSQPWARLRPYLEREPIALAAMLDSHELLAVAQPSPLDAWLTVEGGALDDASSFVTALTTKWRLASSTLASRLRTARNANQLVVRVDKLEPDDLVTITGDVLNALDRPPASRTPAFACPPAGQFGIESCQGGTQLTVHSMSRALDAMTNVEASPDISGGEVIGIRLQVDAPAVLRRGDIVLGLDATRTTSRSQLQTLIPRAGQNASLAVRRDGVDVVLQLTQVE